MSVPTQESRQDGDPCPEVCGVTAHRGAGRSRPRRGSRRVCPSAIQNDIKLGELRGGLSTGMWSDLASATLSSPLLQEDKLCRSSVWDSNLGYQILEKNTGESDPAPLLGRTKTEGCLYCSSFSFYSAMKKMYVFCPFFGRNPNVPSPATSLSYLFIQALQPTLVCPPPLPHSPAQRLHKPWDRSEILPNFCMVESSSGEFCGKLWK